VECSDIRNIFNEPKCPNKRLYRLVERLCTYGAYWIVVTTSELGSWLIMVRSKVAPTVTLQFLLYNYEMATEMACLVVGDQNARWVNNWREEQEEKLKTAYSRLFNSRSCE
jgi:hypothetical protein